jgi:hypothetical protein
MNLSEGWEEELKKLALPTVPGGIQEYKPEGAIERMMNAATVYRFEKGGLQTMDGRRVEMEPGTLLAVIPIPPPAAAAAANAATGGSKKRRGRPRKAAI